MTKEELRNIYKQKRSAISPQQKLKWTDLLLINFQKINLPFISCVHTYMAMDDRNEINTSQVIQYLEFRNPGLRVAIPRVNTRTCSLENYIYAKNMEMALHKFGMAEPFAGEKIEATDIDLIITPLLAFDKKGYRVGFGKGFYDKLLAQCKPDVIKAGLSFFEAEEKIDDIHHNDISLDYCITPETIYKF